jgi:hypothetical protein
MDRVRILADKNSTMMHEFSRRSLAEIHVGSFLSFALPVFSRYLEANVEKEVEKDRLIIGEAAQALHAGRPACDLDLEDIFEKTKIVDKKFLDSLSIPSFSISVRYSDFADIRLQRIWRISRTVYELLENWPHRAVFDDAVRTAYRENEFRHILDEILQLYSLETRMLGEAIRSPFRKTILAYLTSLFDAMEAVREGLAAKYTKNIFGDKPVHA